MNIYRYIYPQISHLLASVINIYLTHTDVKLEVTANFTTAVANNGRVGMELQSVSPLMRELMPSLLMKRLSMASLPVNSSATTYRLGRTLRAASSMY